MFRNLEPFAKPGQGVFSQSPQDEDVSQKKGDDLSLDTVHIRAQLR